jgi:hypothetical protein
VNNLLVAGVDIIIDVSCSESTATVSTLRALKTLCFGRRWSDYASYITLLCKSGETLTGNMACRSACTVKEPNSAACVRFAMTWLRCMSTFCRTRSRGSTERIAAFSVASNPVTVQVIRGSRAAAAIAPLRFGEG